MKAITTMTRNEKKEKVFTVKVNGIILFHGVASTMMEALKKAEQKRMQKVDHVVYAIG